MAYEKKTISSIIEEIDTKKIYLPAIQRKYVWGEDQITKLMDSIMRGYPFGTFLLWKVRKRIVNDKGYSMYEFIKDYHERDRHRNEPAGQPFAIAEGNEDETILSALDGQQRLTSLYIALKGSISMRLYRKRWNNDYAFPRRELYFNLRSTKVSEDDEIAYDFAFLTDEAATAPTANEIWYKVKDIVKYPNLTELNKLIRKSEWGVEDVAADNITLLFTRIKSDEIINYFEVESDSIDDVLDIFVRVNSGGTVLSKSDLLFSTIVSYWNAGREEIDNFLATINKIGDQYNFSNDFVMRTCLYVMDLSTTLKVEVFGRDSVSQIKKAWDEIKSAIKDTVEILNELGFSDKNIVADTAVIPLVYYRFKFGMDAFKDVFIPGTKEIVLDEKMEIRKYMVISQIRYIFGQSTSATLSSIRTELKKHNDKFRLAHLQDLTFTGDRNLKYDESDIESWFDAYEKNAYTFMLLSLLYPNLKFSQNGFHQDHMHPFSGFEKDAELAALNLPADKDPMDKEKMQTWKHQRNTLANLQLLEGRENESKNDIPLISWLNVPANRANVKYLPSGIDYSLANFDEFIEKRKELMFMELKRILL